MRSGVLSAFKQCRVKETKGVASIWTFSREHPLSITCKDKKEKVAMAVQIGKIELDNCMEENNNLDLINEFPDIILINILSQLDLKEAGRTCILSKRTQILWTYIHNLNFDVYKEMSFKKLYTCYMNSECSLKKASEHRRSLKDKRQRYVNWVDRILKLHKAPTLDQFKVCFDLDESNKSDVDRWLDFAISKRTKRLELDFTSTTGFGIHVSGCYVFSERCYNHIKTPVGLSKIKSLTSLSLMSMDVTGEILEHFLANCPHLERLVVHDSKALIKFKVASLSLISLEVLYCENIKEMKINAPSLVYFSYWGDGIKLHLENVGNLACVNISFGPWDYPEFAFRPLSKYFCQLQELSLSIKCDKMIFSEFPELICLRRLRVVVRAQYDDSLLNLFSLIAASPYLEELTLQMRTGRACRRRNMRLSNVVKKPHRSLKVVEIFGFVGLKIDLEFIRYTLDCFIVLERLILHARYEFANGKIYEYTKENKEKLGARDRALNLKAEVPPTVEFIVF